MFLSLEITGKCQLECVHCYAESSPRGVRGAMTFDQWVHVIDQGQSMGIGQVQLIGGEPTLHPRLGDLIQHALSRELVVEVYSNLVYVSSSLWDIFSEDGVRLATSFYSTDSDEHLAITRRSTMARTQANIAEALRRSIPLRVGIVDVFDSQKTAQAMAQLETLGVREIRVDHVRKVGSALPPDALPRTEELCGRCGRDTVTVLPSGEVAPCGPSRWLTAGNVQRTSLSDILGGRKMQEILEKIPYLSENACDPKMCDPDIKGCNPKQEGNDCQPAEPACNPQRLPDKRK